jgi:HSP20 family protein
MNLIRTNVMPSLLTMDHFIDDLFDPSVFGENAFPAVDIRETEDNYLMELDLPGLTEKDVEVKLDNNLLTISSKKEEKAKDYLVRERRSTRFARSFVLPDEVDREKIAAKFSSGVLSLSFPKVPAAKPKLIEVNAG